MNVCDRDKRSKGRVGLVDFAAISACFAGSGLLLRGGCIWQGETVVLVGNAGTELWHRFAPERRDEPDPLDGWTKRQVVPVAAWLGARAVFPSDRPFQPFIAWAQMAEPVEPSPLGMLIHPVYGLWHAYRAALIFADEVTGLPVRQDAPSPCVTCRDRPCLAACPVGAFSGTSYDVDVCAGHLARQTEPLCQSIGCRARHACPVGHEWRYPADQIAFHMNAFAAARASRGKLDQTTGKGQSA